MNFKKKPSWDKDAWYWRIMYCVVLRIWSTGVGKAIMKVIRTAVASGWSQCQKRGHKWAFWIMGMVYIRQSIEIDLTKEKHKGGNFTSNRLAKLFQWRVLRVFSSFCFLPSSPSRLGIYPVGLMSVPFVCFTSNWKDCVRVFMSTWRQCITWISTIWRK